MEKEKRKAFKNAESKRKAENKYYASSEQVREMRKITNYKSHTKSFINNYATKDNLIELQKLIQENLKKFEK